MSVHHVLPEVFSGVRHTHTHRWWKCCLDKSSSGLVFFFFFFHCLNQSVSAIYTSADRKEGCWKCYNLYSQLKLSLFRGMFTMCIFFLSTHMRVFWAAISHQQITPVCLSTFPFADIFFQIWGFSWCFAPTSAESGHTQFPFSFPPLTSLSSRPHPTPSPSWSHLSSHPRNQNLSTGQAAPAFHLSTRWNITTPPEPNWCHHEACFVRPRANIFSFYHHFGKIS